MRGLRGQLRTGQDYSSLKPVYSICLVEGIVWPDAKKVHHAFQLTDSESGRTLHGTLEIHTRSLAGIIDSCMSWLMQAF